MAAGLSAVKGEPMEEGEAGDAAEEILQLCTQFPEGITEPELQSKMGMFTPIQRGEAVNTLLNTGKIQLQQMGSVLIYKIKIQNEAHMEKLRGASQEEIFVHDVIQEAGNKGIWMRDIRTKCGDIKIQQLNKVLKNLESKKLIKSVKSVEAKRKKMYMLYELEPDRALTGGIFYSDGGVDPEVVRVLGERCLKELVNKKILANDQFPNELAHQKKASFLPSIKIWQKIKDSGLIINAEFSVADIEQVLDTLVYDGKAEKESLGGGSIGERFAYRATTETPLPPSGLVSLPCTFCPLFKDCRPGGAISPANCTFFKDWDVS